MPPDYVSTTDVSCDETPKRTKEHLALQNASKLKKDDVIDEESRASATPVKVIDGPEENRVKPKSRESIQHNAEERSKSRHSTTGGNEEINRLNSRASVNGGGKRNSKSPRPSSQEKTTQDLESRSQSKNATVIEEEDEEPPYVIIKDGSSAREKRGKVVTITDTRFRPRHVTIYAGECLNFQLENVVKGEEQQSKVEQVMCLLHLLFIIISLYRYKQTLPLTDIYSYLTNG